MTSAVAAIGVAARATTGRKISLKGVLPKMSENE
jgi:hypothetical protein